MKAGLDRSRGNQLVKSQTARLVIHGILGCEVLIGGNLLGQLVLLDRPGVTRGFGWSRSVVTNLIVQLAFHVDL